MIKEKLVEWFGHLPGSYYFLHDYAIAAEIVLVTAILAWLVLFVFEKFFQRWAKKTKTEWDDLVVEQTKKPLFYFILVYGVKLALLTLGFNGWLSKLVNTLMAVVFVFILARVTDVVITAWGKTVAKKTKSKFDDVLLPLFHKASKVVFVIVGIMWVMNIWGINITPYLAGAGIAGLVLGFALQDSLKNVFGGVTLLLDKTFQVGDKIKLESGELGEVLDTGLRSTKIRTYDNELIYVPNGYLANSRIQNYTRPSAKLRVNVDFGVEYGSNVKNVKKVVLGVIKKMEGILDDPEPVVQFREFGESSLNFIVRFWVEDWKEGYSKKLEATELIYGALNKAKVGIPFPTRTVYVKK